MCRRSESELIEYKLCDQDFMVLFSKEKCLVMDESGKKLISGVRTLDNCYGLVHDADIVCNSK